MFLCCCTKTVAVFKRVAAAASLRAVTVASCSQWAKHMLPAGYPTCAACSGFGMQISGLKEMRADNFVMRRVIA